MRPSLLTLLLATFASLGCGGGSGAADGGTDASEPGRETGPRLVVPGGTHVSFGQLPFFEGATPRSHTRTIVLANQGTAGPETDGALKITGLTVDAGAEGTEADELTATLPESYDPETGLLPRAGENLVEVTLSATPRSLGPKKWRVRIASDDPEQAETTVEVVAEVVAPPECRFEISPMEIRLGLISPPDTRDVQVTFQNEGTARVEECFVTGVRLSDDAPPYVTLADEDLAPRIVGPGESLEIPLRVTPSQLPIGTTAATLELDLANAATPTVSIPIRFLRAPQTSCLTIAPDVLDFGTVSVGCESVTRTFNLYNTCSQAVMIQGFAMQAAAGQPAGGPNCQGSQPCPEFIFTQTPGIPVGGLVLTPGAAPVSFQIRYRPIDVGADTGAVAIAFVQDAANVTAVVTLHGDGDPSAQQADVYTQEADPQADVLLVIDESTVMASHQASVVSNLESFFQWLIASRFDHQVGVVSADPDAGVTLRTGPTHPDAILTPSTANAGFQFAEKVNLGASGTGTPHCLEQAVGALTAPQNAGFVRSTASLAVMCISATTDDSPLPVSDYVADLRALHPNAPSLVTINSAAGFDPMSCPGDSGRLADAATMTSGVTENICTPDWHKSFESWGKLAWGKRSTFYLTGVPDLAQGPLTVTIDGQVVAPTMPAGVMVWSYDAVQNAVTFEPAFVPEPGQTIVMRYWTACYP